MRMQVDFVLCHKTFSQRSNAPARCSTSLVSLCSDTWCHQ